LLNARAHGGNNRVYALLRQAPIDNLRKLAYPPFRQLDKGTEMNWTNLIPGIPLFICLAILAYGFWTAEEEE
jgi:hypothetical protein